jgi:hypothetical protein
MRFGSSAAEDIGLLILLREATSRMIRLSWRLAGVPVIEFRSLVHLLPPIDGDGAESCSYAEFWRQQYRYGLYYYRCGPGFIQVKDVRPGGPGARMTIEDSGLFQELVATASVDQLPEPAVEALNAAIDAGLAISGGANFAILPYRMQHWPVSCVMV